jgi:thiamine kinase-like enzyme
VPPRPDRIASYLAKIPELGSFEERQLSIVQLGGTTNRNYRVTSPAGQFALRVPADDPVGFVNRSWEVQSARLAADAGIGAPLVYADEATGVMLTGWVEGVPLTAAGVLEDAALPSRVARLFKRLHGLDIVFPRRFDAFAIMEEYRRALAARGCGQVRWSDRVSAALDRARDELRRSAPPAVPSHCDPVPHNLLDDGERLILVDWEYAGMNDPGWDLAYFALEAELPHDAVDALVAAYGDPRVDAGRLRSYQLVAAALGVLWSTLRDPAGADPVMSEWASARLRTAESRAESR